MSATRGLPTTAAIGLLLLVSLTACTDAATTGLPDGLSASVGTSTGAPSRVLVTTDLVTLRVGESARVALAGESEATSTRQWATDNARIATVDLAGTITGRAVGSTTVAVTSGTRTTDILVTVLPDAPRVADARASAPTGAR